MGRVPVERYNHLATCAPCLSQEVSYGKSLHMIGAHPNPAACQPLWLALGTQLSIKAARACHGLAGMTDSDRVLCGLTAKHGSPGRPRQGFPEGSAVPWFMVQRREGGWARGRKEQNREAGCGGSSKRLLGI